ncbi:uncharacterized protein [Spinacia oleracea]|nr:uncharacterized protein LOC110781531 isoform X2 [Spinacia oleracea]XP_056692365.1 uncharacterized protein LOC110781531 isoform X2 [Spinacia oleracea]
MEPINIRLYHGGRFVTRNGKTTYEKGDSDKYGMSLHPNVSEVCYFEFVGWVKGDLGYGEAGQFWYREHGHTLFSSRKELKDDNDIPDFLFSKEIDGWYHLYVVHGPPTPKVTRYGPNFMGVYTDSESDGGSTLGSFMSDSNVGGESSQMSSANNESGESSNPNSSNNKTHSSQPPLTHSAALPPSQKNTAAVTPPTQTKPDSVNNNNKTSNPSSLNTVNNPVKPLVSLEPILEQEECEVQEEVQEEHGEQSEGDSEVDSDVVLSEGDYEDDSDDDLFTENVDLDVSDIVASSLEGVHIHSSNIDVGDGLDAGINLGEDADLNDGSEDEVLSVDGSEDEEVSYHVFNPRTDFKIGIKLSVGLKFPSRKTFRKALRNHAIENGYNYYFLHNKSHRITVYCANRCDCEWKNAKRVKCTCDAKRKCNYKVHCRKVKGEETFQIKSLRLRHVCGHQHDNPKVSSEYLAERYLEDWRDDSSTKMDSFIKRVRREVQSEVGYYKCYYAKKLSLKMIYGDAAEEYKRVWEYVGAIRKHILGSTAVVKLEGIENNTPMFQRMYICLQPCKEGFMGGCRPILGVDGCHLRGPYPGILLTAVGKDGNNNIFPVAWAVVETEDRDTWTWFLELLVKDIESVKDAVTWVHEREEAIGDVNGDVTYMSDR